MRGVLVQDLTRHDVAVVMEETRIGEVEITSSPLMPSIYELKPRFQALLRPLAHGLGRLGLTPNVVTVAGLLGSAVAGAAVALSVWVPLLLLVLPGWLLIRMGLNAVDGMMARELGMATKKGAILNELSDVLSDIFIYLPLALAVPRLLWPVIVFTLGAVLTEFSGVLGQVICNERQYQGPMGKSDRAFLVGLLVVLDPFWPRIMGYWHWVFWSASVLMAVTVWNRSRGALRKAGS